MVIKNPHLEGGPFFWEAGPIGILLAHGFTATTAEIRPLATSLHSYGYTVAGPLLAGHYTNPDDLNCVHWKHWVSSVEEMYQKICASCDAVFVGGESTGGLLALFLSSEHAEVSGILTYAPALRLTLTRWQILKLYLASPFIPYFEKSGKDDDLEWQGYTLYPLKGAVQLLNLQRIVRKRIPDIKQPLLIVQGKLDQTVHHTVPSMLNNKIGSSYKEVHWMKNSTHCVALDKEREKVAQITMNFISKVINTNPTQ